MADLLLELFSEEIPARMQKDAVEALEHHVLNSLSKNGYFSDDLHEKGIKGIKCKIFSSPRRLALIVHDLPIQQADISIERKGPKADAPQAAIQGFLKSTGLTLEQLENRDGVYFANIHQKGKPTAELLKSIIEEMLAQFSWPKSMRWGAYAPSWVRPLQSILCIFDGKVVPVSFGPVTASNITYGHRFLSPKAISITNANDYETALKNAHVIADREVRKTAIRTQAEALAAKQGLRLRADEGLLEEVTGLVEWPVALMGRIDAKYMDLPPEVLVSEMRAHQKYFALETANGTLSDTFIITANMETADKGAAIIAGNERVLRARLADGRFFWDQDRKKPLQEWAEGLKSVTYHAKLGSIADKVQRIRELALVLASYVKANTKQVERAAALCKADLVTGMVGEFPELQGVMGRYYAGAQNEDAAVADAIRDHYKPLGPNDSLPSAPVSICIALADKTDTLISLFAIGEKPTGSKDPFALRRAALGVIRIILENHLRLGLRSLMNAELLAFFIDRLKVQLKDQGIRHDVINAVVAGGDDDLMRIVARAKALQTFLSTEEGANLLAAYRRAANILSIEQKKDNTSYTAQDIAAAVLSEDAEKTLYTKLHTLKSDITVAMQKEDDVAALFQLSSLRAAVDQFFDNILVNCEHKELRINRLRLLSHIVESMNAIADFSKIEG